MRILQINMEKGWRGGESQTLLSMEQFRQAGHEVELLARANQELALRAKNDDFKIRSLSFNFKAILLHQISFRTMVPRDESRVLINLQNCSLLHPD